MCTTFQLLNILRAYRILQILGILLNEVQQHELVTGVIVTAVCLLSLSTTSLTRVNLSRQQNIIVFGLLLILMIDCILTMIVLLGGMALVNTTSSDRLLRFRKLFVRPSRIEGRVIKKICRSCDTVKIRFGSFNFVNNLTPLKCIDFANNLTVQLLLITK